ncbi:MAG: TonB-dependent receptor [Acidobacteria bacterium]|nr:TonB-dependent receptor [Acidobacteriota bacterium]MBS1866051.1 TonB-dependent receptor [Acidobacteriota bacterium]
MFRSSRKLRFCCLLLVFLISSFSSKVSAGIFGTVRGIVHDVQHRPIQGAQIELRAKLSDWKRSAVTDGEGSFQIDAVPAGDYTLRISHEGFRDSEAELAVAADTAPLRHFPLELASINQKIEVQAEADRIDPTSSTSSATVTRSEIAALPGASRTNSLDFITSYTPGAYMVHDQLHIRGGHQVSWLVDGVPVPNTNIAANVGAQFDPKDIDVVEIQRGGLSAEYGDRTYASFNIIPRSGFERDREAELVATYGSYHATDSQLSFGDHSERFAWYASVSGSRSDIGLMPPERQEFHDNNNGLGAFTSLIFNVTPKDQLRFVGSARGDYFQIPNTLDQQQIGTHDVERERDVFGNFSWVRTVNPGVLFTVAPFFHWNRAAYDGYLPSAGFTLDDAPITTNHNDSHYEGGLANLAVTRGRHNARFGLYGFAQQDDAFFRIVNTDGTPSPSPQSSQPHGSLFSFYAEDQFRLTNWLTLNGGFRFTHFSGDVTEDKTDPRLGAALRIPKLNWVFRASYSRFYQAPPLTTISGPLLAATDSGFLPLRGETDEEREFGLAIPIHGWTLDFSNFQTHALNFFDHDALGNSNIFLPLTIERARIHGWESTVRSPRIAKRFVVFLSYANLMVQGSGVITGGLIADPGQLCDGGGFCYLDHDQRNTLSAGFHASLPWRTFVSGNLGYGSGFLNGNGPQHLPDHTEFSLSLGKSFGEKLSVNFTAQNIADSRYQLDDSNTFGGTHWNYPRQISGGVRYRFHF